MKKAVVFKIRPGHETEWRNWCQRINTDLNQEALASLREEGLVQEIALTFQHNDTLYMIGYTDGEAHPSNQEREINQLHAQKRRDCLEYVGEADVLYSLLLDDK